MVVELESLAEKRPSVWVADDDRNFLDLFKVACGSVSVDELHSASSGAELMSKLNSSTLSTGHAIIFVDIRMEHEEAGFEVVGQIRRSERLSLCPVVVMSSSLLQEDVRKAARLGANCYFYKPVGTRRRVEAVKRHVEYWASLVLLPEVQELGLPRNRVSSDVESARGTAWYAVDRLRQDLLVAMLRDLDRLSAIDLPETTKLVLDKVLVRLSEVFSFRSDNFGFGSAEAAEGFAQAVHEWIKVGPLYGEDTPTLLNVRRKLMVRAKAYRSRLSTELRQLSRSDVPRRELSHLDFLIWDIFVELAHNPEFQYLFTSFTRFQKKAFD